MAPDDPTRTVYDIHLVPGEGAGPDLASPVTTEHVEYYDSGVWVDRDADRVFLPYDQIRAIVERAGKPAGEPGEAALAEPDAT